MCDDDTLRRIARTPKITRRSFAAIVASAASVAGTVAWGQAKVVEKSVTVKTPDGEADAALFYPEGRGQLARRADLGRYHGPAAGVPRNGPPPRVAGLCGAGAQPLLSVGQGRRTSSPPTTTSAAPRAAGS
jgi:hypothetical protein